METSPVCSWLALLAHRSTLTISLAVAPSCQSWGYLPMAAFRFKQKSLEHPFISHKILVRQLISFRNEKERCRVPLQRISEAHLGRFRGWREVALGSVRIHAQFRQVLCQHTSEPRVPNGMEPQPNNTTLALKYRMSRGPVYRER